MEYPMIDGELQILKQEITFVSVSEQKQRLFIQETRGNHAKKYCALYQLKNHLPAKSYSLPEKLIRLVRICNWTAYIRIKIHVFLCFAVCVVLSLCVVDVILHLLMPQEKSYLRKTFLP